MITVALLLAASAQPDIHIAAVSGQSYVASVDTIAAGDLTPVVDRIRASAKLRCGRLDVRFGRFKYDNRVDLKTNVPMIDNMKQNFFCFDPATDPYKPVPADWTASAAETANATVFVTRFLDQFDTGDAARGMAMMDPLIEITPADWDGLRADAMRNRTGAGTMTPKFVAWLNNPDGAAYPGAYAYFSVIDDHPGIAGTCGGILLQRVRENEYRVSQYDVRYISQALVEQQGLTDEQLDGLCRR